MKLQATVPTGKIQSFEVNETFFSTTDLRGNITAGNAVFSRTSGFALEELIGQPHNLIRHPDMPRQVFRLLWESAKAGRSFMGYVKNQARNGNHYWVFAVIVPIPHGYLSVRIKPTSPLLSQIDQLYGRMIQLERNAVERGATESHAADASAAELDDAVHALGFASYAEFSHHALNTEIKWRDDEIARRGLRLFPETAAVRDTGERQLDALYGESVATYERLIDLFGSLDGFLSVSAGIRQRQDAVQSIAEEFRLNALNAHLAAHPLGQEGVTLGTVAQLLNGHGQSLSRNVALLTGNILNTTSAVADIASNLASARLQLEMLLTFLAETAGTGEGGDSANGLHRVIRQLHQAFSKTLDEAVRALAKLEKQLPQVLETKEALRKDIVYLQVAQISGLTEVSRLTNGQSLYATFTGLRSQIETGKHELDQLGEIVDRLRKLTATTPPKVEAIHRTLAAMQQAQAVAA